MTTTSESGADHYRYLFLTINYAPEQTGFAPHVAALCEKLASDGDDVTVITGFPFAPQWRRWDEYRGIWMRHEVRNGVKITRVSHFVPRVAGRCLQRILMEGSFCVSAAVALLRSWKRPAVVVYVGAQPSIAMLTRLVAAAYAAPYVVWINDLAADAATDVGIVRGRLLAAALRLFEFNAYRAARAAIVLCSSFRDALITAGVDPSTIHIIRSPIDIERIAPLRNSAFRRECGISGEMFVVLYAGSMGLKQGLDNVVRAAEMTSKKSDEVIWVIVGEGETREEIARAVAKASLTTTVKMYPLQPAERLADVLAAADVLLLNQLSTVKDTVIPSKLLTYMAAGRAVVAAVNPTSQAADILSRADGGVLVEPENPVALAETVMRLREELDTLKRMGARNRAYAEEHFDQRKVLARQNVVLREVAAQSRLQRGIGRS